MAEKLTASTWTGFMKKLGKDPKDKAKLDELDDKALVRALTAFDKTDEAKPEPRLEALTDLVEQFKKQVVALARLKKALGDKLFDQVKDQLYELLGQAEAQLKKTQSDLESTAKEDDGEEPDSPALLTSKMVPLLRQLRKGDVRMHALVCTAGKNTAVLIMRRPISRGRRNLLAEAVDAKGGMKYAPGDVAFEDGKLTFVLQAKVSQLAKRLRQALLDQTQMRFKVKLRGEDGAEEEDGEDEGGEDEGEALSDAPGATPQAKAKPAAPPGKPASAEQLAYTQRLIKVRGRVEQAEREGHPQRKKFQPLLDYATAKADENQDYAGAMKGFDALEALLATSAEPAASDAGGVNPKVAFDARLKALFPDIQRVMTGPPPNAEVKLKLAAMGAHAKKGDFGDAHAVLDEIERLLAGDGAAAGFTTPPQTAQDPKAREVATLRAALQSDFDALLRGPLNPVLAEQFQPLRNAWTMAQEATDKGLHDRALLILGKVASAGGLARLRQAMAASGVRAGAASAAAGGAVALAKLRLKWNAARAARQTAIDSMLSVADELLATEEYADDPRTELARSKLRALGEEVPLLDEAISDLLDDFAAAPDDAAREKLRARIQASIRAYMVEVDAQPLLTALQNTPLGFTPIRDTIFSALTALEAALA